MGFAINKTSPNGAIYATIVGCLLLSFFTFRATAKLRFQTSEDHFPNTYGIRVFRSGLFPVVLTLILGITMLSLKLSSYLWIRQLSFLFFLLMVVIILIQAVIVERLKSKRQLEVTKKH
jgi:hypothetical protein